MRVGIIGLGKLGLPVAYALASRGIEVYGYDPRVDGPPASTDFEEGLDATIEAAGDRMKFASQADVVCNCEVIFVAVQTPHESHFEGITPLPDDRADFDYTHLKHAVKDIVTTAQRHHAHPTIAVISTVLPGTMEREVKPLLKKADLVYNPSFIAMGTTIRDFLDPEFILLGGLRSGRVRAVYEAAGINARFHETTIPNAELTKVAYNTFIGLKLAFANTLQEVCHKTDCDVDEITDALSLATRRLISPAYMRGGMGDGGGCHPRDNIALSWLAGELDLSYDLFEAAMLQRERHAEWLVDLMEQHAGDLKLGILGYSYKPGSHLLTGSPALLVRNIIEQRGHNGIWMYDPHVVDGFTPSQPRCWLVGCKHPEFPDLKLPEGSVVIDPWRYIPDQEGVQVVRLGEAAGGRHRLHSPAGSLALVGQRAA